MARIIYGSLDDSARGPFPHKAGEFCGNVFWREVLPYEKGECILKNPAESFPHLRLGEKPMRFFIGRPEVTKQGEQQWMHGLYLTEDQLLSEDEEEIDTDMFVEEVVSGERPPEKPFDFNKMRRREL